MKKSYALALITGLSLISGNALANEAISTMHLTTDTGQGLEIGTVTFKDTPEGLNVSYNLRELPAGELGFHVHENADCSPIMKDGESTHAMAAGGHYDPEKTGRHLGPDGLGHRGDLPALSVNYDGTAVGSFTFGKEKGLKAAEFKNRALMIHAGGDNYSDEPKPLGGGGARIACGIIN